METAKRQRLMREMGGEPIAAAGTAMKCGAALAILTLLAVIGTGADDAAAPVAASRAASAATGGAAAVHRREVFEERRARRAAAPAPRLATDTPQPR